MGTARALSYSCICTQVISFEDPIEVLPRTLPPDRELLLLMVNLSSNGKVVPHSRASQSTVTGNISLLFQSTAFNSQYRNNRITTFSKIVMCWLVTFFQRIISFYSAVISVNIVAFTGALHLAFTLMWQDAIGPVAYLYMCMMVPSYCFVLNCLHADYIKWKTY